MKYKNINNFYYDERDFDVIAFDIDDTLTESKEAMDEEMEDLLERLLKRKHIAILSGGSFYQFEKQILKKFKRKANNIFNNLFLFPANATEFYVYNTRWKKVYCNSFSLTEKKHIFNSIKKALIIGELEIPKKTYGDIIEDRGGQITFSALGMQAPLDIKKQWDPHNVKKEILRKILSKMLPRLSVKTGGTTSIDITKIGFDKAYGLTFLTDYLDVKKERMLYIGDALYHGGNDEVVLKSEIKSIIVANSEETKILLRHILKNIEENINKEISPITDNRPWGHMREFVFNEKVSTKIIYVNKGEEISLQTHKERGEFWKVLRGNPLMILENKHKILNEGDEIYINTREKHQVKAIKDDVEILEIAKGNFKEADIIRYNDKYGRK